jgi:hypothetical protein
MIHIDENLTSRMAYDSSRSVVSVPRALWLSMPKLRGTALFIQDNKVVRVAPARTSDHAHQLGAQEFREPSVSNKELRGSKGRPKSYSLSKKLAGKSAAPAAKAKKAA